VYLGAFLLLSGCGKKPDEASSVPPSYMYVSSGACYSGNGNTTFTTATASNKIFRINLSTEQRDMTVADYKAAPSIVGDSPVGVTNFDAENILVAVDSATAGSRRIEKIEKRQAGSRTPFNSNLTALSAALRKIKSAGGGWFLTSKTNSIEKIKDGLNRAVQGANPFINLATPVSNCTTATTLTPDYEVLPSGHIVVAHAAVGKTGFSVINSAGYSTASDCMNNTFQSSPDAASYPTSIAYDKTNSKLLVAYAGNSTANNINTIMAYSINETTGAISSPQEIYDSNAANSIWNSMLLYGVSAMALDEKTNSLYVATAISNATTAINYRIEKISYDGTKIGSDNNNVLKKQSTLYDYDSDTLCISQMSIVD
jgi:hypothetical protein